MAFGSLILTNKGREVLTRAQLGAELKFTGIAIGDGSYNGSYNDITALSNQLAVLDILRAETKGSICMLEADISNEGVTTGYYFRELGILAKNGDETVLYAYTNAGEDAEYIPAGNGAVSVEKRLRLSLLTEGASDITFDAASVMYVEQKEFDETVQDIQKVLETKQDCFVARIDLSGNEYSQSTYYPVTGTPIPKGGLHKIHAYSTFDTGAHPTWATNAAGYTCNMEIYDKAQTWGQADSAAICTDYSSKHASQLPLGYLQMPHSSTPVLTLRGGGIYYVATDYESEWTARTDVYTYEGDTVRPGTKRTLKFDRATIFADINGDVTGKVNGYTLGKSVPSDALFTDTVYTHPTTAGNKHIPSGGSAGQILRWDSNGTAIWENETIFFGVDGQPEGVENKAVEIPNFTLADGVKVTVYFAFGCLVDNPTLNVSGTGDYPIMLDPETPLPNGFIEYCNIADLVYYQSKWYLTGCSLWRKVNQLEAENESLKQQLSEVIPLLWNDLTLSVENNSYYSVENTGNLYHNNDTPAALGCSCTLIHAGTGARYKVRLYNKGQGVASILLALSYDGYYIEAEKLDIQMVDGWNELIVELTNKDVLVVNSEAEDSIAVKQILV